MKIQQYCMTLCLLCEDRPSCAHVVSSRKLVKECQKRGYSKPPYSFKVAPAGFVTVTARGATGKGREIPREFGKGLPKVKRATPEQLRVLLRFISEDPRLKLGSFPQTQTMS